MLRKAIASLGLAAILTLGAPGCAVWYADPGWDWYPPAAYYGPDVEWDSPVIVGLSGHRRDFDHDRRFFSESREGRRFHTPPVHHGAGGARNRPSGRPAR